MDQNKKTKELKTPIRTGGKVIVPLPSEFKGLEQFIVESRSFNGDICYIHLSIPFDSPLSLDFSFFSKNWHYDIKMRLDINAYQWSKQGSLLFSHKDVKLWRRHKQ